MPDLIVVCQDAVASASLAVAEAQTAMAERMVRGEDIAGEELKVHAAVALAARARVALVEARLSVARAEHAERQRVRAAVLEALDAGPQPSRRDVARAARLKACTALPALAELVRAGDVTYSPAVGYARAPVAISQAGALLSSMPLQAASHLHASLRST
jgi:hypothetical protein